MSDRERSLRVLVLTMEYGPELSGGVGTHALELSRALARCGHRVDTLSYTQDEARTERSGTLTVHRIPPSPATAGELARLSVTQGMVAFNEDLVEEACRLAREGELEPDVVQYFNWITFPAARKVSRELGVPAVGTIGFISDPPETWWGQELDPELVEQERWLMSSANHLITVSESMRRLIREAYGAEQASIDVVHNGMDFDGFSKLFLPERRARDLRETVAGDASGLVVFAGRLNGQKGVEALIEAGARVLAEEPDVRFVLAGEPDSRDYQKRLRSQFERFPECEERFKLLGKVPRRQIAMLLQIADVVTVPSIYEPFGYVAIEAMAAGSPVVVSNVGGLGEIVTEDETGLLVPVHACDDGLHRVDVEALARRLLALLRDRDRGAALGEAGRQEARRRFDTEAMAEGTVSAYRKAIATFEREAKDSTAFEEVR